LSDTKTTPTKVDEAPHEEGTFTLEDLDSILKESDSEFVSSLQDLKQSAEAAAGNIELLDIDGILAEEESKTLKNRFLRLRRRINNEIVLLIVKAKNIGLDILQVHLPDFLKFLQKKLKSALAQLSAAMKVFKHWSLTKKLASVGIFFLCLFVVAYVHRAITHGIVPEKSHLFVNSLDEWAEKTYVYTPGENLEPFYDSARVKQNIMSLRRIVVNIKPSVTSGPNPMVAFEFFIEGLSSDVTIEIKDREPEVLDLIQRLMEEKTFDELDSADGKVQLNEKIKKELNTFLSKGKVKKVYIKNAIVKP